MNFAIGNLIKGLSCALVQVKSSLTLLLKKEGTAKVRKDLTMRVLCNTIIT
jgi:hypothetical protein